MKCGNCRNAHGTVAEVRTCYGTPARPTPAAHPERPQVTATRTVDLDPGYYTVSFDEGDHRTFRASGPQKWCDGKRVLSLLTGPDNTWSYSGVGFILDDRITLWRKFKDNTRLVQAVKVLSGDPAAAKEETLRLAKVLQSNHCFCCGRMLTDPVSIELGIGPVCRAG